MRLERYREKRNFQATPASPRADTVAGIKLSHPDKPYFPEADLAKRDLARYYETMAERALPYLRDRPLALVRCPDGWRGQCFYQKHADASVNAAVTRVEVPEGNGTATYFGVKSAQALVALVQWGVIELHPWGSRAPKLDRPDRLIFDFDPDDGVSWKALVEAVGALRVLLDRRRARGIPEDDRRQGAARRRADPRDARLEPGQRLHQGDRRCPRPHVPRPIHRDGIKGKAQRPDLH